MFHHTIEVRLGSYVSVVAVFYKYEVNFPPVPEPVPITLSAHSIIRWAERYFGLDMERVKLACAVKWKFVDSGYKISDGILNKWLRSTWPDYHDCVRTLRESIGSRCESFEEYDYTFIIRDGVLITVYERGYDG